MKKTESVSSKTGTRQEWPPLLFNTGLVVSARTDRQEKHIKRINQEMKSKYPLFADGMSLYIKDPKDSVRKLSDLINTYSHVTR